MTNKKMNFLLRPLYFNITKRYLFALIVIINLANVELINAAQIQWKEVPSSNHGRQWFDKESIERNKNNTITLVTKFSPKTSKGKSFNSTQLYVMEINCDKKLFRDKSINGIPQSNQSWSSMNNDLLINGVINEGCSSIN